MLFVQVIQQKKRRECVAVLTRIKQGKRDTPFRIQYYIRFSLRNRFAGDVRA